MGDTDLMAIPKDEVICVATRGMIKHFDALGWDRDGMARVLRTQVLAEKFTMLSEHVRGMCC
jgi:hypothetical protein